MKRIIVSAILVFISLSISAQELQVSTSDPDQNFLTAEITQPDGISVKDNGQTLLVGEYQFSGEADNSLQVYSGNDGSFVVRENGVNFLFYDSFGKVKKSISNSAQSQGGEANSELAMDLKGKTIVLYNPRVKYENNIGSAAQLVGDGSNSVNLYYSQERAISVVDISANGEFIAITTTKSGTDDEVLLMDRFGNELNTIPFDQDVKGISFSENGLYATIYSGGRAAVYEIRSGERTGSTSFRNAILQFAGYSPEDDTIIGLTGNGTSTLTDVELHAINVAARKIVREEITGSFERTHKIDLVRIGSGRYTITGLSKELILRASF